MVLQMKLAVGQEEYSGLLQLALAEMRHPEDQLCFNTDISVCAQNAFGASTKRGEYA